MYIVFSDLTLLIEQQQGHPINSGNMT